MSTSANYSESKFKSIEFPTMNLYIKEVSNEARYYMSSQECPRMSVLRRMSSGELKCVPKMVKESH